MVDQSKLQESKDLIIKIINDTYPNLDTRRGTVINELIAGIAALGYAMISEDINSFENKMYLQSALTNPESIDGATLDAMLSNFLITRKHGSKAQGIVKIEVDESRGYIIDIGSEFKTVEGLIYTSKETVHIEEEALYQKDDLYYFFVDVEAEAEGGKYTIGFGTVLNTEILSGSFVSAEAFNDFHSGIDQESNEELLKRTNISLGVRALSHRQAISTILQEQFPEIRQLTAIGYNDREMQRDKNNIGFKVGGKADIYIRTSEAPLTKSIAKTTDANGNATLSSLDLGEIPILRVANIALAASPINIYENFSISVQSGKGEPVFFRFSVNEIIVVHTDFISQDILITVDYLPFIKEIQSYVNNEDVEYIRSDTLVKSYMPCFISLTVSYQSNVDNSETEEAIRSTLINFINSYDEDVMYVSKIIDKLHDISIVNINLPLEITGTFHLPDGTQQVITSENHIEIDDNFNLGVSKKTYRFFITPSDISLNKESVT